MSPPTPEERVGTTIAEKYRLESILGRGGMGVVFAAVHEWTGRPVAVKLLISEYVNHPEVSSRFLQEARAAARLDHPNVVDVLDMGKDTNGNPYMVLELLHGEDLGKIIKREKRLDAQTTLDLLLPVMDALGEAHALGIVHRDIKPENIFIAESRAGKTPKLLDFGIAKVAGESSTWKTSIGGMLGTPYFMSPEQIRETAGVGPASDVWAIGVLIYLCLSGTLPFYAKSSAEILAKILTTRPPTLDTVAEGIPVAIAHVVDVALREEPEDRHIDMTTFAEELRDAAQASGTRAMARVEGLGLRDDDNLPLAGSELRPKKDTNTAFAATTPAAGVLNPPPAAVPTPSLAVAQASTQALRVQKPDAAQAAHAAHAAQAAQAAHAVHAAPAAHAANVSEAATVGPLPEYGDQAAPNAIDARTGELILGTTPFVNSGALPVGSKPVKSKKPPVLLYVALAAGVLLLSLAVGAAVYVGFFDSAVDDDPYVAVPTPPTGQNLPPGPVDSPPSDLRPPAGPSAPIEGAPGATPTPVPTPAPTPAPTPTPTPGNDMDPAAETGTLTVIRRSACVLTIDGQPVDDARELALAPGTHSLVCRRRGTVRRASVDIVAGREATHTFRFPRRSGMSSRMSGMSKMGGSMLDIGRDYE